MNPYALSDLSDQALLRALAALVARECTTTAEVLAHIAEVDTRKLYLPAAYSSMFAYCVGELHFCEQAAFKRILAARTARRFPAIFAAVADGRLHLSAVVMLAPHLSEETADELLAAATHRSKSEIDLLLARRFPRPDVLAWLEAIPPPIEPQAPGPVENQLSPGIVTSRQARGPVGDRPSVKPLSPQSFAVQFTMSQTTHDKLRYAQELLSHQIAPGDVAQLFDRVLDVAIPHLETRKFAATSRPPFGHRPTASARHIPADVQRTVWERDHSQCTFVSEAGRRCPSRARLEFDHIEEVARGGEATVAGIRLRCRAHNQYGAECTFGAEFMRHKRLAAAEARAAVKARNAAAAQEIEQEVVPWLRQLGFSSGEARSAAALCENMPHASLEERVRMALSYFRVRGTRLVRAGGGLAPAASLA